MKKYEMTDITLTLDDGAVLHRIRALAPIYASNGSEIVSKGESGGWIEHEGNLSQSGNCWVFDNAKVYGNAKVTQHAWIKDNAVIKDNAHIYEWATVCFDGIVGGNVKMGGAGYFTGEVNKQ